DRTLRRRNIAVHHPRLSLQGGRPAAHEFPSAAFDPVHAGLGLLRPDDDACRLSPRHRSRLSILFLWRRLPALSGAAVLSRGVDFRVLASDGAARTGEL